MGSIPTLDFIGANTPATADQLAEETAIETAHGVVWPSAPQCVHGAIFDLDGTLLDSMPWWDDLGERYLRSLGKTPEPNIRYHFKRLTMETVDPTKHPMKIGRKLLCRILRCW